MPKPDKQIQIDAIVKWIEQGKSFDTSLKLSATKWNLTRPTFIRRWNIAKEQHTERQQKIKEKLAKVDEEAAIEARKMEIMTAAERKEVLTKIANGTLKIKRPFVIGGKIMEYPAEPDATDRRNAIAELNKMEGDYAPSKVAQTDKDGNDIKHFDLSKLSDNELRTLAELQRKGRAGQA